MLSQLQVTEKLLILCDLLDTDLDYLLRNKAPKTNVKQAASASICTPYLGKWVKIFFNDQKFQGLYCIAAVAEEENFLLFIDAKGKRGLLNISAISSIMDADKEKYKKLPKLPVSVVKPISFCSVTIREINTETIVVHDKKGKTYTTAAAEFLYIMEQ